MVIKKHKKYRKDNAQRQNVFYLVERILFFLRFKNETRTNKRNEKSFGKPQRRKSRTTNPFYFLCKQNEQRREPSFHYLGSNSNFNFNACFSFFFQKKNVTTTILLMDALFSNTMLIETSHITKKRSQNKEWMFWNAT